MAFEVGQKVTTTAERDYNGVHLASFVHSNTYEVMEVKGDRVVIGRNGVVTAAVSASTLSSPPSATTQTKADSPTITGTDHNQQVIQGSTSNYAQNYLTSLAKGFDSQITQMIDNYGEDITKYSMRLFGLPHQFTQYCDYRTYSVANKPKVQLIGRTFLENIMLEAPVVTILPGKPIYLPAKKGDQKSGWTQAIVEAANSNVASLAQKAKESQTVDKVRYYDFQQDYTNYMKYVDIMCQVAAAFLDLESETIDGETPLTTYMWEDYRWTADKYSTASANIVDALSNKVGNFVSKISSGIKNALGMTGTQVTAFNRAMDNTDDSSAWEKLDNLLSQMNFVQFYVDSTASSSENNTNNTTTSKLEGIFDSANDVMKEFAFIANSGGMDTEALESLTSGATNAVSSMLSATNTNIGGMIGRLLSSTGNVIKGNTMIFPKIYQNSTYSKSYNVSINLKSPYGNKFSFYLNILVPLFHLMCLALPKQETANSYGSPFIIKAYYPGVFSCNLGIVQSLSIQRATNGDWSVDGYPMDIKVELTIEDLYSDLSITPSGVDSMLLFLANTSLIEFIATNCGVNLITPQLQNRVKYITTVVNSNVINAKRNVENAIANSLESQIYSLTHT